MKPWQRICFNEAFPPLPRERGLPVHKTPYNLLTGVPRIKKATVQLSRVTWFRPNHKGGGGDRTSNQCFACKLRVNEKVNAQEASTFEKTFYYSCMLSSVFITCMLLYVLLYSLCLICVLGPVTCGFRGKGTISHRYSRQQLSSWFVLLLFEV